MPDLTCDIGGATYNDLEKRIEQISDEDPLEKRIQDAELLRDLYVRNGKERRSRLKHRRGFCRVQCLSSGR